MTDKTFTLLFFGLINAIIIVLSMLCYYTGTIGGLVVLIPFWILIVVISIYIIWTEVITDV